MRPGQLGYNGVVLTFVSRLECIPWPSVVLATSTCVVSFNWTYSSGNKLLVQPSWLRNCVSNLSTSKHHFLLAIYDKLVEELFIFFALTLLAEAIASKRPCCGGGGGGGGAKKLNDWSL